MKRIFYFSAIFLTVIVPFSVFANVRISEIMYDVSGSDSGREWVEVLNDGSESIDLTSWKFFEANTNHGLTAVGEKNIPVGGYAIIVEDKEKFLVDWSNFSGQIFESSFSLSNTGEVIGLKNDMELIDQVTYSSGQGANGDGNSLQKMGSDWKAASPTPGAENQAGQTSNNVGNSTNTTAGNTTTGTNSSTSSEQSTQRPIEQKIFPQIILNSQTFITGAVGEFSSKVLGTEKKPIDNARCIWSFGDGGTAEGPAVIHTFLYPGDYSVTLDASSGEFSSSDRITVHVIDSPLSISNIKTGADGFIEISNSSNSEISISNWTLATGGKSFVLPKNTTILGKHSSIFPSQITGLSAGTDVKLLYQNGTVGALYNSAISIETRKIIQTPKTEITAAKSVVKTTSVNQKSTVTEIPIAQTAAVIQTSATNDAPAQKKSLWIWLLGLFVIIGGSIASLPFLRKKDSIDEIKIID
ncbi:lamin tail domain-containing protein [Candidatus Parcubacteria bacterium]|nr:lamin tail domain-containing protein [Candidatus Parcubacteria bacterium]